MVQLQPRTSYGFHQLDSLLEHSLRQDPVASGHRTLGMPENESELIVKISRAAQCFTET
jgi:hypothetical protein